MGRFTPEEDRMLTELYDSGMALSLVVREINKKFGVSRTRNSLAGRLFRLRQDGKTDPRVKKSRKPVITKERKEPLKFGVPRAPKARRVKPGDTYTPYKSRTVEISSVRVPLLEARDDQCRAILEGSGEDTIFCGNLVADNRGEGVEKSYCPAHWRLYVSDEYYYSKYGQIKSEKHGTGD